MSNAADEIRARTEAFVADLSRLIKDAALEAASTALGGGTVAPAPSPVKVAAKRGRGRPRKAAAPAPVAKAPAAARPRAKAAQIAAKPAKGPAPKRAQRAAGEKRPPAELAKLTDKLGDYIKANPGKRMEAIGKALGMPTKELNLPIKKLLAVKKIKTQGHKRATQYFPT
jgi:hypothetical protein